MVEVEVEQGSVKAMLELEANCSIDLGSVEEAVVPVQVVWLTIEMENQVAGLVVAPGVAEQLPVLYRNFA